MMMLQDPAMIRFAAINRSIQGVWWNGSALAATPALTAAPDLVTQSSALFIRRGIVMRRPDRMIMKQHLPRDQGLNILATGRGQLR